MPTAPPGGRDGELLSTVSQFRQVLTKQAKEIHFPDNASDTPCRRSLNRLKAAGYLKQIEQPVAGGKHGGSGPYVWALDRQAVTHFDDPFEPDEIKRVRARSRNTVDHHAIGIVEVYLRFLRAERAGHLTILGKAPEPDCHYKINGIDVRPDLRIEVAKPGRKNLDVFIEYDRNTEHDPTIRRKLNAYIRLWESLGDRMLPVWWVADSEGRARQLKWLISQLPKDDMNLFQVWTLDTLFDALLM